MPDGLKIVVGGDVTKANQALQSLDKQIDLTTTSIKSIDLTVRSLSQRVDLFGGGVLKFTSKFTRMPPIIDKANVALNKFNKTSSTATQATLNLGRVVQDAPFGFLGIANNLNPLLESFQRLRAESGSTGVALKSFGKSLVGAGGLGLALSVVSSLVLVFSGAMGRTKSSVESLKDSLEKYVNSLNDVIQANVRGSQSAQQQLVALQTLYAATQNANIPLSDRKKLVDELQKQYPSYFKNISDEIILAGGAEEAYKKLSTAILNAARARAAQDALVEIQKQVLAIEQKQIDNLKQQEKAQSSITAAKEKQGKLDEQSRQGLSGAQKVVEQNTYLNRLISTGNSLQNDRNKLLERANNLVSSITKTVEDDPSALLDPKEKLTITPDIKIKLDPVKKLEFQEFISIIPPEEFKPVATEFGVMFQKELKDYFKGNPIDLDLISTLNKEQISKKIASIFGIVSNQDSPFSKMEKEAIVAAQTIQGILTPAFTGLFDAILQGESPIKSFFQSLGNAVTQLIQKLISAAVAAAVLSLIFPGGVGGVQGFGKIFGKLLGFADGGLVTGPQLALIGEGRGTSRSNPEVVAPLDRLRSMLTNLNTGGRQAVYVTGRLRGNDMILQNARTSRSQRRTSGR